MSKKQTVESLAFAIRDAVENQSGGPGSQIQRVLELVNPVCRKVEEKQAAEAAAAAEEPAEPTEDEKALAEKEAAVTAAKNAKREGANAE